MWGKCISCDAKDAVITHLLEQNKELLALVQSLTERGIPAKQTVAVRPDQVRPPREREKLFPAPRPIYAEDLALSGHTVYSQDGDS
jgi:hypothetical protein